MPPGVRVADGAGDGAAVGQEQGGVRESRGKINMRLKMVLCCVHQSIPCAFFAPSGLKPGIFFVNRIVS